MPNISERSQHLLGLNFFSHGSRAEKVSELRLTPPKIGQYVLRCPILIPDNPVTVPTEMTWCEKLIEDAFEYQHNHVGVRHPFAYLTIRHGFVTSKTDDEFHVDGFSMKVPHIPEHNYVWADTHPTETVIDPITVPDDFDPLRHNIQYLIQDSLSEEPKIEKLEANTLYAMDPYVPHRRPHIQTNVFRTFVRLSMTPIPIDDRNNFSNPAFGTITSDYDGVVDFRDKLKRYPE